MTPNQARRNLAYFRMGLGSMWVAPRLGAKLFGMDPEQDGVTFLARLFAVRDLALGLSLMQSSGADADRQVDVGIMVDALDLVAILMGAARKDIGARTVVLGGGAAAAALMMGLLGRDD